MFLQIIDTETKASEGINTDENVKDQLDLDLITQMNELSLAQGPDDEEIDNRMKDTILNAENPVFRKKYRSSKVKTCYLHRHGWQ